MSTSVDTGGLHTHRGGPHPPSSARKWKGLQATEQLLSGRPPLNKKTKKIPSWADVQLPLADMTGPSARPEGLALAV